VKRYEDWLATPVHASPKPEKPHYSPQPYEQLKKFTRGEAMTQELMRGFIAGLEIPQAEKDLLLAMTPGSYTGKAAELAKRV